MAMARSIARSLAIRLPCDTITPLGAAVEPEVYCKKAMASAAGDCGVQRSAPAAATLSTAITQAIGSAPPKSPIASPARAITSRLLSTQEARQSRAIVCKRRVCLSRADCGANAGTAISPAYRQAKNATT